MFIYSISNPENPTKLSSVQHFTVCDPVTIARTLCNLKFEYHLRNNTNVLQVYDQRFNNPKLIHSRTLTQPKGISFIPLIIYWFAIEVIHETRQRH
jgi:hypothetical protein